MYLCFGSLWVHPTLTVFCFFFFSFLKLKTFSLYSYLKFGMCWPLFLQIFSSFSGTPTIYMLFWLTLPYSSFIFCPFFLFLILFISYSWDLVIHIVLSSLFADSFFHLLKSAFESHQWIFHFSYCIFQLQFSFYWRRGSGRGAQVSSVFTDTPVLVMHLFLDFLCVFL